MEITKDIIRETVNFLKERKKNSTKQLKKCPQGHLRYEKKRGKYNPIQFISASKGNKERRITLNKLPDIEQGLALKAYLIAELNLLETAITALEKLSDIFIEPTSANIIATLPRSIKRMPDHVLSTALENMHTAQTRAEKWAAASFFQSTYKPEQKREISSRGLHVRSRAEIAIVEMLYKYNVPFRYEMIINADGLDFAPDFTILTRNGTYIYWEHAGMMNKADYRERHNLKMKHYEKEGITPWNNLIITYDMNDHLDMRIIEATIKSRILPYI